MSLGAGGGGGGSVQGADGLEEQREELLDVPPLARSPTVFDGLVDGLVGVGVEVADLGHTEAGGDGEMRY